MNKYIKPTFMLASLGVSALAAGSCDTVIDKDTQAGLEEDFGANAFFADEICTENPVDGFCKLEFGGDAGDLSGAFSS